MDHQKSTEDRGVEAQTLLDFYIDLIENSKNLLKYYLSEDVVLDWFGQTVKGQKNVATFLKTQVIPARHLFREARPTNKIGFRDTHVVRTLKPSRRILRSTFLSPPRPTLLMTPQKKLPQAASTSARRQIDRPNLLDSFRSPPSTIGGNKSPSTIGGNKSPSTPQGHPHHQLPESPRKRQRLITPTSLDTNDVDILESENDISDIRVKYLTADGNVEFHRPSLKKLQRETKWQRPCKIHIAYDSGKDIKDSSFYLIIYEGNVKCRRNLMQAFEAEEPED